MRARCLGLALLLLQAALPAAATPPELRFAEANAAYERGDYDAAAAAYAELVVGGIEDARLEYNLGNAEFRLGRLGRAILHFERARRLEPTDEDVIANLDYARSFCLDRVTRPREARILRAIVGTQNRLGGDRQAWVLLGFVWATAGLVAWCFAKPGRWGPGAGWLLVGLLSLSALVFVSWWTTDVRLTGGRSAVVLADAVDVLAGPAPTHPVLFTVHEGLTVDVRRTRDGWLLVGLPSGLNGWIPREAAEPV